jgi:hypothetical protein
VLVLVYVWIRRAADLTRPPGSESDLRR